MKLLTIKGFEHKLWRVTESVGRNNPDRTKIKQWAKVRLWCGYAYLLMVLIMARPAFSTAMLGTVIIVIGVLIRLIAASTLIKDDELCTDGIYSVTRNPLYLGSSLVGFGFAVIGSSAWIFAAYFLVLVPIYVHMINLEENFLREIYGTSFELYRRMVPGFFPRTRKETKLLENLDFTRLRKNREITSAVIILILTAVLLILHKPWLIF